MLIAEFGGVKLALALDHIRHILNTDDGLTAGTLATGHSTSAAILTYRLHPGRGC